MNVSKLARRTAGAAAAVVLSGGLVTAGLVAGAGSAAGAQAPAAAASRMVTLINGDRVAVTTTPSGVQVDAVARAAGGGANGALIRLNLGGQAYDIPADALPYLGRGLSPALFEVSSLLSLESGGRLPVQVSYQGQLPALPGVTITSSGAGTAHGYLTAASAAAFGAALARQLAADHAHGSYGTDGIFAGGVLVGLPGQAAAPGPTPDFPMHTLTVTGTNLAGQPDTGDFVQVINVDDFLRFNDLSETTNLFYQGATKFSVPEGHYLAVALYFDFSGGGVTSFRLVWLPQLTVTGNTSVALNEGAATDQIRMVTPRPSVLQDIGQDVIRVTAAGQILNLGSDFGNVPVWTNQTTRPVTVGTVGADATGFFASPAGVSPPYEYNLAFADPSGLIGSPSYPVRPGRLATVPASFYQDTTSAGAWSPAPLFPFQLKSVYGVILPLPLPGRETGYFSAGRGLYWLSQFWQSEDLEGGQAGALRTLSPGRKAGQAWNAYPLHPAPNVNLLGAANPIPVLPSASQAGNTLTLDTTPFSDSTPGHTGSGFSSDLGQVTGSYQLYQDGKKIAGGDAVTASGGAPALLLQAPLSGKPATLRFVLTASRTGGPYLLSTASRTVWTWRAAAEPGASLPAGWTCADLTQSCAVQPMMTLQYQVRGLGIDGSAPPGPQLLRVTAGHLQLARAARITGASVRVSFDDGKTWQAARVTGHGGQFRAAFTALPGAHVTLRVSAADAAGGSITETITRGYQIAS